jgi:hypothetical protein
MKTIAMQQLHGYIKKTLGIDIVLSQCSADELSVIPLFIKSEYQLFRGILFTKHVIFIFHRSETKFSPDQYRKHIDVIEGALKTNVVLVLDTIESFNRGRLIGKQINFIVPGKQLYLPAFLIDLKEFGFQPRNKQRSLDPAAQCLLLYHLLKESLNGMTYIEVAQRLPYSYLTIARAVQNLCAFSLCTISKEKQKRLIFADGRKLLWDSACPYLSNPIKKTLYADDIPASNTLKISGMSALTHYTMINDGPGTTYAVGVDEFRSLRKAGAITNLSRHEGKFQLEVWKYSPVVLTETGLVDPLSLFLIFKGHGDERIEKAIAGMIEEVVW